MVKLKFILFVTFFAFIGSNAVYSQKKIKLLIDEVNEFTGDKIQKTQYETIVYSAKTSIVIKASIRRTIKGENTRHYLDLSLETNFSHNVLPENSFYIKLSNGEVIKLKTENISTSTANYNNFNNPSYGITKDELERIQKYGIVSIRYENTARNIEEPIKGKRSQNFQELIKTFI